MLPDRTIFTRRRRWGAYTYSGIARARDAGKRFGRPPVLNEEQKQKVLERIKSEASISAIAREFRTTRQTILRVRAKQQTVTV
ncbi:Hin recombinase [Escherichia coli]|nr:Hin recombinase [Escherichia coli]